LRADFKTAEGAEMSEEIQHAIRRAVADDVQHIAVDGVSVQSRPIPDLIEGDKYLEAKTSASKNHMGLSFRRMEPGGTG
jgi:hypothetical protein